jgi:hypothetical protein
LPLLLLSVLGLVSSPAWAEKPKRGAPADAPKLELEAEYFQGEFVTIDSDPGEWNGVKEHAFQTLTSGEYEYDWSGPKDLSATLQLLFNDDSLFLYVKVKDNILTAPKKGKSGDVVELWFDVPGVKEKQRFRLLSIELAPLLDGESPNMTWKEPKKLSVETLSLGGYKAEDGYDFELELPFSQLGSAPLEGIGLCVVVKDFDYDDPNEDMASTASCPFNAKKRKAEDMSRLEFGVQERLWKAVLASKPELEKAERLSARGELGGDERPEEVVLAKGQLVVMGFGLGTGTWYSYDLGLGKDDEVVSLEVLDANGDGSDDMVVRTRHPCQAGGVAYRQDLLSIFTFGYGGISDSLLEMVVAQRSQDGTQVLENSVSFGKKSMEVKVSESTGADEGSFHRCALAKPTQLELLVPWVSKKRSIGLNNGVFETRD